MHRVSWRRQTDQRHRVEFLKNLEKEQKQSRRRFFSETNHGTGPMELKREREKKKEENEKETD